MASLRTAIPAALLLVAVGCGASAEEDAANSTSAVRRDKVCSAEVDVTLDGFATVTADTTGVQCYDDNGDYAASIDGSIDGRQSVVRVFQGQKKKLAKRRGTFIKIRGVTSKGDPTDCWMSADYLCASKTSAGAPAEGWDQAANDGAAKGAACEISDAACCTDLTGTALTACQDAMAKRQADAEAQAAHAKGAADEAALQTEEAAGTASGTTCFEDATTGLTWDDIGENASHCCHELYFRMSGTEYRPTALSACVRRVNACRDESAKGGVFGSRVCP